MKSFFFFLIGLGVLFKLPAQYNEDLVCRSLESQQYDIQLPFSWENGKLIVSVKIGEDSLRFFFDTGALCVIKSSLAERYKFKAFKQGSFTDANNAKGKSSLIHIDSMEVDGVLIEKVPTAVLKSADFLFDCLGVDGILGSNVLIGSLVHIDYQNRMIRIQPSGGDTLAGKMVTSGQNSPYFQLSFGEKKAWFLFDSGANAFGDISPKTRRKLKKQLARVYRAQGVSGFSALGYDKPDKIDYYRSGDIYAGSKNTFRGIFAVDHENRLGTKMLQQGDVMLDFKTKSWSFIPHEEGDTEFAYINILPMQIDGKLVVGKKSAALRDVSIGDPVLKIAGMKTEDFNNCQLVRGDASRFLEGKMVVVQSRKGNVSIVVKKEKIRVNEK